VVFNGDTEFLHPASAGAFHLGIAVEHGAQMTINRKVRAWILIQPATRIL
jgi:hypothetical protein